MSSVEIDRTGDGVDDASPEADPSGVPQDSAAAGAKSARTKKTRSDHPSDYRRAFQLIREHRGKNAPYVMALLMLLFEAGTAVLEPLPIAYTIDFIQGNAPSLRERGFPSFLTSERAETIVLLGLGIIAIVAINKAADSFAEVFLARGGRVLGYNIRVNMYDRLQRLSMAFHDKRRTGDVITRVTGDVLTVEEFVVDSLSNIIASGLLLVGSFAVLMTQSSEVALIAAVVVPSLALVANFFSRRLKKYSKKQRAHEGDLASTAQEMLSSIRLVQIYGRGHTDLAQFSDQTSRSMKASLKVATIQAQFSFVIALLEGLTIASVVWMGVWLVDRGSISAGTLVLFVLLIQNMFKPSRKIVSEWYKIGKLLASTERVQELLDREPEVVDRPDATAVPGLTGRLELDDVHFAYRSDDGVRREVLHGITLQAAPGEVVALVGASGAGKSTIAQLVPRLYDPDDGSVRIDGHDVRDLTLSSLRGQISLVLQDTMLLTGTVAENIAYGIDDPGHQEVVNAARLANAHDFITGLPDGYDTVLGERGSTLSGGQRQRIAIARAFIRRAPLLVLDEPTTGLDPGSAAVVVEALRALIEGTTAVIISHDAELVKCADRILVMDSGRIVAEGDPVELASVEGPFADLFGLEADAAAGETDPDPDSDVAGDAAPRYSLRERVPLAEHVFSPEFAMTTAQEWADTHAKGQRVVRTRTHSALYRDERTVSVRVDVELVGSEPSPSPTTLLIEVRADDDEPSVSEFPHDPGLPTLPVMLNAITARLALERLPGFSRASTPAQITYSVVHHPRTGACVVRYDLHAAAPADGRRTSRPLQVFAKVYPTAAEAIDAGDRLRALGHGVLRSPEGLKVRIPALLEAHPDLQATFLESVAPTERKGERRMLDKAVTVREAAQVLQVLHAQGPRAHVPTHLPADEVQRFDTELALVGQAWPDVADRVEQLVVPSRRVLLSKVGPLVLSHGDFTPSQLMRRSDEVALLDYDSLCLAEASFDAGRFLAYHDLGRSRRDPRAGPRPNGRMSQIWFLATYESSTETRDDDFRDRVGAYRTISLGLIALRAARRFKEHRLELALKLLESGSNEKGTMT